jgi:hypothetical protein
MNVDIQHHQREPQQRSKTMKTNQESGGYIINNAAWSLAIFAVAVLSVGGVFWAGAATTPVQASTNEDITVYKNRYCGCCHKWIEHLEQSGLTVAVVNVDSTSSVRSRLGVPGSMASCHTAIAGDYWIEGHVPADLIARLLEERPADIEGIAVPGMPVGSPGMEGPNAVAYDILALKSDGSRDVYATREGKSPVSH